jgi:hypothetical protein
MGTTAVAHAQFPFQPAPQPGSQPGQQPFPQPAPPSDPRVSQIKAGLEQQGLRVLKVAFIPGSGQQLPRWYAETAANYAKPDYGPVGQQALMIWAAMYNVVSQDPPQTVLIGDQVWTKYSFLHAVQIGSLKVFVDNYRGATTDAAKTEALQTLFRAANFRVYDNERRQFVDEKDFVNKNFGGG